MLELTPDQKDELMEIIARVIMRYEATDDDVNLYDSYIPSVTEFKNALRARLEQEVVYDET